jgi:WD40 repeat protein
MQMKSPFKFLDSYTKEDRSIFFGRDREIEELYHRVFESKIMLVYGISGTGKSSLIHCGLANKFQDTDWLPVVIRRGSNIVESMAAAISSVALTKQNSPANPADFRKRVRSLYLDHYKPVFFIFDQFEELFIFGNREERRTFIQIVKSLTESDLQCRVIFVMREEYMAAVTEFERFIPTFFSNRVRIEKMSHRNAVDAIKGPCNAFNINLEEGFAESLLEKLSPGSEDVELTYLQVFLDKIFRLATGFLPPLRRESKGASTMAGGELKGESVSFTLSLLEKTGNVTDLLGSFLDEQVSYLDNPDTGLAVLKSFVSIRGTKRLMSPEEVSEYTKTLGQPIDGSVLNNLLQSFVGLRILRDKDNNDRYELRHDALAAKIFEKITLVEKEILEVRQFIENAYSNYEKRKIFLGVDDLKYIAPYNDKLFIDRNLREFIENSKNNITAKKRAFSRTLIYSALGFFIILASIVVYYFRSNVKSKSDDLAFESTMQKDFSPGLSFQTALMAYHQDSTSSVAIKGLFDSFYALLDGGPYYDTTGNILNPRKTIFDFTPCKSAIRYARFSEDGKYIYGFLEDNTVNVWDTRGRLVFSQNNNIATIVALKLNPSNDFVAAVFYDSTASIWNIKGTPVYKTNVEVNMLNPLDVISFSPDKKTVSILKGDNKITILNLTDSTGYDLAGHTGKITGAVFSPDGNFIASASLDSTIIIWQYNSGSGRFELVNRIADFNGPVWSVDFSENSKYVLSVADSGYYPILLHRLTGKSLSFRYFMNREVLKDSSIARDYPREYYGNYYSAKFVSHDAVIRIMTFADYLPPGKKAEPLASNLSSGYDLCRIIYDYNVYQKIELNNHLRGYGEKKFPIDQKTEFGFNYSFADVTEDYIALNIRGSNNSLLIRTDRLPVRQFKGHQPVFSPDGNYLMCLNGNMIELYPVNEKEIIRLAEKESVFGEINTNLIAWRHFMKDY